MPRPAISNYFTIHQVASCLIFYCLFTHQTPHSAAQSSRQAELGNQINLLEQQHDIPLNQVETYCQTVLEQNICIIYLSTEQ